LTTAGLADRLRERLEKLDAEALLISRALAALHGGSYQRARSVESKDRTVRAPVARRNRPNGKRKDQPVGNALPNEALVLEALQDGIGSRGSMLALTSGLSVETVRRTLESLERRGRVRRDGLGWRLADN
jgi:hypothetical protein